MINCVVTVDVIIVDPVRVDAIVNEFNANWDKVNVDASVNVVALIFKPDSVENNTVETVNVELTFSKFTFELVATTVDPTSVENNMVETVSVEFTVS